MGQHSFRLGLTGGIASGKSTVAAELALLGGCVIDADAISRAVTSPNGAAVLAIRNHFGSQIVNDLGEIDRDGLRQLVFSNRQAKADLEAIIHPLVRQSMMQQARDAERQGAACIVFDIPLLVESGLWQKQLNRILVVDCTPETQVARIKQRNGLSPAEIEKIIAAQAMRGQRLAAADAVLFNDGLTITQLQALVGEMAPQFGL